MQDLRTVILLRRQLNQEQARSRPWIRVPRTRREHAVWRRGWHSLLRMPATRILRMAILAAAAGVTQAMVMRGTTPALLLTAGILFVLGMEAMEPLSQEVDQPDRTESLPIDRGSLMSRHLAAPAVALVPFALVGAAAATATMNVGHHEHVTVGGAAAVAAILCLPTVLGGADRLGGQHRPRRPRPRSQRRLAGVPPTGDGRPDDDAARADPVRRQP